ALGMSHGLPSHADFAPGALDYHDDVIEAWRLPASPRRGRLVVGHVVGLPSQQRLGECSAAGIEPTLRRQPELRAGGYSRRARATSSQFTCSTAQPRISVNMLVPAA